MTEKKVYSYAGKILRINLTTKTHYTENTSKYFGWLGQRGIGQYVMYNEVKPSMSAFDPNNKIILETGPLTGTLVPSSGRISMSTKNTYNGGVGTSNAGGFFASELKYAGYDFIIIEGRAQNPVYIWIDNNNIQIRNADMLMGRTTWDTEDLIREDLGDKRIHVMSIGPAGENLVRGACLIVDKNRALGKCGGGAVFGSKNLKAIAVRGNTPIEIASPERFTRIVNNWFERINESAPIKNQRKVGTIAVFNGKNNINSIPYKNFQETYIPDEISQKINVDAFMPYKTKSVACSSCPVYCSKVYSIFDGPYAGLNTEGLEMNTVADFGGKCGVYEPTAIVKMGALTNQLGVDMDLAAGAISWAIECFERGIIDEKDTDGLKLSWGDHGVIVELINKIAYRQGFGNILAEGSKRAAEIIGKESDYYAIHVKGQDIYEEVRLPLAWGLGTCVATRAGGHTTGAAGIDLTLSMNPDMARVGKKIYGINDINPKSPIDKPKLVMYTERHQAIINSLGLCMFIGTWNDPNLMAFSDLCEIYSAATGIDISTEEMIRTADRIINLEKAFNVLHCNFTRADDYPPERCLKEGINTGPNKGFSLSENMWGKLLDDYYQLHGWDPKTGLQTKTTLDKLGLTNVANDLDGRGRLR